MMFAKKCPKCGGNIQTKVIKKAIGLGTVDIPVSQFCLNPSCDWYQDFAEAKRPEEIKENVLQIGLPSADKLPEIKKSPIASKHIIALGVIAVVFLVFLIISSIFQSPAAVQQPNVTQTPNLSSITPEITATSLPVKSPVGTSPQIAPPKTYYVNIDVGNGFVQNKLTINRSDTIQWIDRENMRLRIVLISNDKLFENKIMQDPDRFSYQFNKSGNYTFALAEYPTLRVYPNATGIIIVR